jgi:hypothetical protein
MSKLKSVAAPIRCGSPAASAAIMLGIALATAPTIALAEAQVRGSPESVTLEAKNTSVGEILAALGSSFDLHYRSSASLERRLTGNYEGSLQRVMQRVLAGFSYVARIGDGGIDLTVVDGPITAPVSGASPAVRVVPLPADSAPAERSFALAANEPSVIPDSSPTSSVGDAGRPESDAPAQPAAATIDEPPLAPGSPAKPRQNDHFALAGGKELRVLPPRKIKMASSPRHLGSHLGSHLAKSKHHVRRTRRVRLAAFCKRPIRSFGLAMTSPVSSYYWPSRQLLDLRSAQDWRAEAVHVNPRGLKRSCRSKQSR